MTLVFSLFSREMKLFFSLSLQNSRVARVGLPGSSLVSDNEKQTPQSCPRHCPSSPVFAISSPKTHHEIRAERFLVANRNSRIFAMRLRVLPAKWAMKVHMNYLPYTTRKGVQIISAIVWLCSCFCYQLLRHRLREDGILLIGACRANGSLLEEKKMCTKKKRKKRREACRGWSKITAGLSYSTSLIIMC